MSAFGLIMSALPPKADIHVVAPRRRLQSPVETLFGAKSPAHLARLTIGCTNFLEKSTSGGNSIPVGRQCGIGHLRPRRGEFERAEILGMDQKKNTSALSRLILRRPLSPQLQRFR